MNYIVVVHWNDGQTTSVPNLNRTEAEAIFTVYDRLPKTEDVYFKKEVA